MPSPHEVVNSYVDPLPIFESLQHTGLSQSELDIAVSSIQRERAQWVVDHMVQEMSDREVALLTDQERLATELQTVTVGLTIAGSILDRYKPKTIENANERIQRRITKYNDERYDPYDKVFKTEAPFTFTVPKYKVDESFEYPSMETWFDTHEDAFRDVFGDEISKGMVRMSRTFDREFGSRYYTSIKQYLIANDILHDNGNSYTFSVSNPVQFFDTMFDIRNFGVVSGILLLCVADFQALETTQKFAETIIH